MGPSILPVAPGLEGCLFWLFPTVAVAMMTSVWGQVPALPSLESSPSQYHQDYPGALEGLTSREQWYSAAIEDAFSTSGESPELDSGLVGVCDRLLELFPDDDFDLSGSDASEWVEFLLRRSGVTDAVYVPLVFTLDQASDPYTQMVSVVLSELAPLRLNRYGLAIRNSDPPVLVAVFTRRFADLAPFPMEVSPGSSHLLWGSLMQESQVPTLMVAYPEEGTMTLALAEEAGMFWSKIYFPDEPGVYTMEVLVNNDGPQVASLFPVYVGVPVQVRPVTRVLPGLDEDAPVAKLEAQAFGLLNSERSRRGLSLLKMDPGLSDSARSHSRAMAQRRRLTHTVMAGETRPPRAWTENISVSTTLSSAHLNLMSSPSHRRTILDSRSTFVGIGIVEVGGVGDTRALYMTQRFMGPN